MIEKKALMGFAACQAQTWLSLLEKQQGYKLTVCELYTTGTIPPKYQ